MTQQTITEFLDKKAQDVQQLFKERGYANCRTVEPVSSGCLVFNYNSASGTASFIGYKDHLDESTRNNPIHGEALAELLSEGGILTNDLRDTINHVIGRVVWYQYWDLTGTLETLVNAAFRMDGVVAGESKEILRKFSKMIEEAPEPELWQNLADDLEDFLSSAFKQLVRYDIHRVTIGEGFVVGRLPRVELHLFEVGVHPETNYIRGPFDFCLQASLVVNQGKTLSHSKVLSHNNLTLSSIDYPMLNQM